MSNISTNAKVAGTVVIHDDVIIEEGAVIHDFVVLYPHTIIHKNVEVYDHCVIGKLPTSPGSVSRKLKLEYKGTVIHENSILCPGSIVYSGTEIGNNTLLGDNCSIREDCTIGSYCIISRNVSINYETSVGDHTKIMDNTHITGNMRIGHHVFISVLVATTNDNTMGRSEYGEDHVKGPVIEDYVTIGAGANILPNVRVGENSIVGASALVTRDVPPGKVVMGVPAKVIRDV